MLTARWAPPAGPYVNGYSFEEYLAFLHHCHPELFGLLSERRCREAHRAVGQMNASSWEFEDERAGGRGQAYNGAQLRADNRRVGMTTLLRCLHPAYEVAGQGVRVLDVLGGNGTFARFCRTLGDRAPTIYTADISKFMIDACHAQALPCVRQPATNSLFRDNVLDGVLIAYGSHHLDAEARRLAVSEAHRTLRPGGRLVLHDFEAGGRSARWFDRVVHPYSRTGHPHPHFSRREMFELFAGAGFRDVTVCEIADPFTLHGRSPDEARHAAVMHMYAMYDLIKVADRACEIVPRLERHIANTLGPMAIRRENGGYVAEIPRAALVAVGRKAGEGSPT